VAFLLFLSYLIGFSHYLIPHCENAHETDTVHDSQQNGIHLHQHHIEEGLVDKDQEHDHFQHSDHFDEGIYDFLVCFLSEVEHPDTESGLDSFIVESSGHPLSNTYKDQLLSLAFYAEIKQYMFIPEIESKDSFTPDIYPSPHLLFSPNKGPPYFTC